MSELMNCPNCDALFVKTNIRNVCQDCWKQEEKAYETVYDFMRKRENRAATITQVVEATGIEEELIYKFVKSGRLKTLSFPNFGYPCDRCGHIIRKGNICEDCQEELKKELKQFDANEERKREMLKRERQGTYFSEKK